MEINKEVIQETKKNTIFFLNLKICKSYFKMQVRREKRRKQSGNEEKISEDIRMYFLQKQVKG
jgi:hypothetical protein